MKNLFRHWDNLKKGLSDKYIMLFLDYDGTLTPIVSTPEKAFISQEVKDLLNKLSKSPTCKLAIISGRALKDIKNIIGLKEIIYSGNHGLEIEGPKIKFKPKVSLRYKAVLERIKNDLNKKVSAIKGAFVENKGFSMSLHYRLVDKKDIPKIKNIFHETIVPYLVRNKIKIRRGKMVLEVKPPVNWDKGKVVLWLLTRQKSFYGKRRPFPIYIGDDITDEDAFRALKNKGLTIFVGKSKKSHAGYCLKNTKEVLRLLKYIMEMRKEKYICQSK